MNTRLEQRVARLEVKRLPAVPFVIAQRPGESDDDAARRYFARWPYRPGERKRHLVLAPKTLSPEAWLAEYGTDD